MSPFYEALARLRTRKGDFRGMSLVETLIAMTLTLVISGTLVMTFGGMVRGSSAANEQLSRSAEADRIAAAWTADVQNVDVGGVNASMGCANPASIGASSQETFLVSFMWNSRPGHVGTPQSSAWVLVGSGTNMQLVRRVCKSGAFVEESVLATRLGKSGQDAFTVVHGPGADPAAFCPPTNKAPQNQAAVWVSDTCSIVFTGAFTYRLDVSRGVPEPSNEYGSVLPPLAPTITDTLGRNQYVTVSWGLLNVTPQRPGVEQYELLLFTDLNQPAVAGVTLDGQSNVGSIMGLTNGVQYFARVHAKNSVGWGPMSDPVAVTPLPTGPDAPTVTSVTPSDRSVMITWTPNPNDGGDPVNGWTISVYDLNNVWVGDTTAPSDASSATVTGLTNGTSYRITVRGHNQIGEGLPSALSDPVIPYGPPPPAGSVYAIANESKAQVRWSPPADDNGRPIVGYVLRVYQGIGASTPASSPTYITSSAAGCVPPSNVCQVDQPLTNGSYYRFTIASRSDVGDGTTIDGGESEKSAPYPSPNVQPKNPPYVRPSTKPANPQKPGLSVSGTTISVTFTVPDGGGEAVQRVFVQYASKSTATPSSYGAWTSALDGGWEVTEASGAQKTVTFTGSRGNIYKVKVTAGNKGEWFTSTDPWRLSGESPDSDPVTVVGASNAPGTPTVARLPGNTYPFAVQLAWTAPTNNGGACVDQYKVEYSANGTDWGTRSEVFPASPDCAAASAAATSSIFSNLAAGEGNGTRYFRVAARNSGGWSSWSSAGQTTQLRQECTLTATETAWVGDDNGTAVKGTQPLKVRYLPSKNDTKNFWTYIKFDQRAAPDGSQCAEFDLQLPGAAIPDGAPGGYSVDGKTAFAVVLVNRSSGPGNSEKVAIHQAASPWTESAITWSNKPDRANETDSIKGGSNGYRWWWVDAGYAVSQRNSGRNGWILGQKDGDPEWQFDGRSGANPPLLKIRFR